MMIVSYLYYSFFHERRISMGILFAVGQALFSVWSFLLFIWVLSGWPYEPLEEWIRSKMIKEEETVESTNVISLERRAA
jgi:hypothetical protein